MWTIEKLNQYIEDQIEESLYLDYKAADSLLKTDGKKNEIAKDVSAFANSDGGTIIYGMKEFQSGPVFLPEKIDPIDNKEFSKETLEQIINSRISPRLHGVVISSVIIGDAKNNQVVYIVDIPKSDTAHQASDKKYYRRYNFQSIPMDDWEIKDIINRKNKAIVEISFRPELDKTTIDFLLKTKGTKLAFDILATNKGNKVVKYCDCMILGRKKILDTIVTKPYLPEGLNYFEFYYTNEQEYKVSLEDNDFVINSQRMAILPHTFKKIGSIEFFSDFFIDNSEITVIVTLDDNRIVNKLRGQELIESIN